MRLKLLYTLVFIFCLSALASSKNECAHPFRDGKSCNSAGSSSGIPSKEVSKEISDEKQEFSTFQLVKFLYI